MQIELKKKSNLSRVRDFRKPIKLTPEQIIEGGKAYIAENGFEEHIVSYDKNGNPNEKLKYMTLTDSGLSIYLGITRATFWKYHTNSNYGEEYHNACEYICSLIEDHNARGVSCGDIATTWGIFYFKNKHGYVESNNVKVEGIKSVDVDFK